MKWEKVNLKVEATGRGRRGGTAGPGNRWGHTCNALKRGRFLYVFGGYGNQDDRQTNEVHVFDTVKQSWSKPMVKGTPPSPRDSHTCTTVGTSLYVFGGTDGRSVLQDLYILDTVTNTWGKPKVNGEIPAPREGHSAALIGTNIFIFGGCGRSLDDEEDIYFNDLHMLDTVRLQWSKVDTKGKPPVPRDSHTCSTYESKLIVLGGEDSSNSLLGDVQILDTSTMEWRELQTAGEVLTPRAGHAAVTIGKLIFVFGGFSDNRKLFSDLHMLDLGTGMWSKVAVDGKGPSPRFSLAGDCVMGGFLVFIGGCNDNLVALDDMYYLDTEMQSEKSQSEKSEKFSMRKELKRKRQETQSLRSPVSEKGTVSAIVAAMNPSVDATNLSSLALLSHPGPSLRSSFYDFKPSEERVFEAKITNVFHYGYTIESVVDGKPLRGLLFCYKPGFANAAHAYLTKKKLDLNGGISLTKQNQSADSRLDKTNLPETSASTDSASAHNACYRETQLMDPTCITDHPQHLVKSSQEQPDLQRQTFYQHQSDYLHLHELPDHNPVLPENLSSDTARQQIYVPVEAGQYDPIHIGKARHDEDGHYKFPEHDAPIPENLISNPTSQQMHGPSMVAQQDPMLIAEATHDENGHYGFPDDNVTIQDNLTFDASQQSDIPNKSAQQDSMHAADARHDESFDGIVNCEVPADAAVGFVVEEMPSSQEYMQISSGECEGQSMNGVPIQEASGNGGGDAPGGFTVDEVISSQGFNQTSYESLSYETSEQKSQTPKTQDLPNTSHVYPTVESSHLC